MSEDKEPPGLTVGQVIEALRGLSSELKITIRTADFCGGIISIQEETDCSDKEHVAFDCSDGRCHFCQADEQRREC